MNHLAARHAIAAILSGQASHTKALALITALRLADHGSPAVADKALAAALAMPADSMPLRPHPSNQEPLPVNGDACWAQLATLCADQPAHLGHGLAQAAGLARLWSSATPDERPLLRSRYLSGLLHCTAPLGSYATRDQLRAATRDLPTSADEDPFTPAAVAELPRMPQASDAHRLCAALLTDADRIGPVASAVATVACRAVGSGARADQAVDAVLAALLLRHHSSLPPEVQAQLVLQAAHQTWWSTCGNRPSEEITAESPMATAIAAGQTSTARRSGRRAAADGRFWNEIEPVVLTLLDRHGKAWVMPLALLAEVPTTHQPSPDLAAAIAAGLAKAWVSPSA